VTRLGFLQGNEAALEGALDAGARFFAGYPITPSSEIAELAARKLPARGGVYMQMEDELASIAAVIGASLAGARSFTATSGPGFSLMQENLGLAYMMEAPCVVINVQRSGPSTGLATRPAQGDVMQARWGTHGDASCIALSPSGAQDCYDLTVLAFEIAERNRTPVVVLADEVVGHMRERVQIARARPDVGRTVPTCSPEEFLPYAPAEGLVPALPDMGGPCLVRASGSTHDERGYPCSDPANARSLVERLRRKVEAARCTLPPARRFGDESARTLIVSYGSSARAAREAAARAGRRGESCAVLELPTLWPFPEEELRRNAQGAAAVLVVELNMGQVVLEVRRILGDSARVHHCGKNDGRPMTIGEVEAAIEEVSG